MEQNIFAYIWRYSKRQQIIALLITLASFPLLYLSLEVPKVIINEALGGQDFPKELFGMSFDQVAYLLVLCGLFLALVIGNGLFKMRINIYKGVIAERLLRRLRFQLVDRILRFPRTHFQKLSQGELIPMITAEVEPLGGLMGDAIAHPVFQGGQMLTILIFLFVQNPVLGVSAIALIPVQAYVIPRLQRRVNVLHKERVRRVRKLADRISETVVGAQDIHLNDISAYTRSEFSGRLGEIFHIRFDIYRKKFFMKFVNNMMNQITPFFFYSIGGYLVISGNLTIGALVAALAAYKDLTTPWKELLTFYNQTQEAGIRYQAVIEQFAPKGLMDEELQRKRLAEVSPLDQTIELRGVSWEDEDALRALTDVSFTLAGGSTNAIVGPDDEGRERLAQLLNRTLLPTAGTILIGEQDLATLPEAQTGARIGYVGPDTHIFSGTVGGNIELNLKRNPPTQAELTAWQKQEAREALASGNSPHPFDIDWVDYTSAGFDDVEQFRAWCLASIQAIGAEETLFARGLNASIDADERPELAQRLLAVRRAVKQRLDDPQFASLVRRFERSSYNPYASVAENLLFGLPTDDRLALANLAAHPYVKSVLEACSLRARFEQMGLDIAAAALDMFQDLAPGHPLFEQYEFVDEEALPRLKSIQALASGGLDKLPEADRELLMALPFRLIPEKHRLGLIDAEMQQTLVSARAYFHEHLPPELEDAVDVVDEDTYLSRASVLRNVLFGRIATAEPGADQRVRGLIVEQLDEAGLREDIILLAASLETGTAGTLLPGPTRQQIALLRALTKRPDVLILNQALASFTDHERQAVRQRVRELLPRSTLVWIDKAVSDAESFDQVLEVIDSRVRRTDAPPEGVEPAAAPEQAPEAETRSELQRDMALLSKLPLFSGLSPALLKLLAFTSEHRAFAAGDVLFHQGDPTDGAYVVLSGELDAVRIADDGRETLLGHIGPNEVVGELAVICDVPRTATVRAGPQTSTLFLERDLLLDLITKDVGVASTLLKSTSQRLAQVLSGPAPA